MTSTASNDPAVSPSLAADSPAAALPHYDRHRLVPAVVHLGAGSFHRAHQAVYFDDLAEQGCTGWGVVAVAISKPDLPEVLAAQDHTYVVVEQGRDCASARVVGSLVESLVLADDPAAVVDRLSDPRTRLVTMTITGNGYEVDDGADGAAPHGGRPGVFDAIVTALDARRRNGVPPFTVLSCDNLPDNGAAARRATVTAARRASSELAEWIERDVSFPSSMVDRITPGSAPQDARECADQFGVDDRWPVVTEPFRQWVIEDRFTDGRPPLDLVGARFVDDVAPYKLIKNRLLNGSHCALGYLGLLAGYETSSDAMADEAIARFIGDLMHREIAPALPDDVAGMELEPYQETLLERFANPAVADRLARLAGRGSRKMPDYLLPSLHHAVADGRSRDLVTLAVAAWARCLWGTDLDGQPIEISDARLDDLRPAALAVVEEPDRFLALDVFADVELDDAFAADLARLVVALNEDGVSATIERVVGR